MPVELKFTADTVGELETLLVDYALRLIPLTPKGEEIIKPRVKEPDLSTYPDMVSNANKVTNALEKKAPRKAKLSPQGNGVSPEPLSPEPSVEALDQAYQAIARDDPPIATDLSPEPEVVETETIKSEDLAALMTLKESVIDALQAAFRAGKVQKVRSVLADYGNGAKSFREIDMKDFPAISAAIQKGGLA